MASRRRGHSGEDEATAIDMREASSKVHAALAKKRKVLASPNAPTKKAQISSEASSSEEGPLHQSDDSGEEATEFLARPASSRSASPSAVQPAAPAPPPFSPTSVSSADEDSRTMAVPRWAAHATPPPVPLPPPVPSPVPAMSSALPKAPRPLPGRDIVTEARPLGGSAGPTAPRITRIFQSPDAQQPRRPTPEELQQHVADFDDERTAPSDPAMAPPAVAAPPPRAPTVLAPPAHGSDTTDPPPASEPPRRAKTARNSLSASSTGSGAQTLEAEPADGTLIVDVPAGAVVFVNGVERGRGPSLRVRELDRYAKHAVRVHADGFAPWKGTVSLDGRVAAKVRPNLRARGR